MNELEEADFVSTSVMRQYKLLANGQNSFECFGLNALLSLVDCPESIWPSILGTIDLKVLEKLKEYCEKHVDQDFDFPAGVFVPGNAPVSEREKWKKEAREKYLPKYVAISAMIKEFHTKRNKRQPN